MHCSDDDVWRPLFTLAYRHARPAFVAALFCWLKDRGNRHTPIDLLKELPIAADAELENVILGAAKVADGTAHNDFELFSFLLQHGSASAEACLRDWAKQRGEREGQAVMAEALLLNHRAAACGEEIIQRVMADISWGTRIMAQLNVGGGIRAGWLTHLSSESITRLWEWLEANFPPDPYGEGHDGSVTLDHNLYHLKNSSLGYLEGSGRTEAPAALEALARRHPEFPWFGQLVAKARHVKRRGDWAPPIVAPLCAFLAQPRQKPLCSDADLCDALLISLARYQRRLKGPTPPTELWNEPAGQVKVWSPKDENNFSDCLARFVTEDLREHGVIAVRESETRQQTGAEQGDEPDLVVFAPSAAQSNVTLRVVVEVKCAWNPDVLPSMRDQLHDRYLREGGCGIYVTAYFTCPSWTGADPRRTTSLSRESFEGASQSLLDARKSLVVTDGRRVDVVTLDCRV